MTKDLILVRDPVFLKHSCLDPHPEKPSRLSPLLEKISGHSIFSQIQIGVPCPASFEEILRVHSPSHLRQLEQLKGKEGWIDADTYYGSDSVNVAHLAAGSCWKTAQEIWTGKFRRGFCLVRPPGHHARAESAMGFCLLNNIAAAVMGVRQLAPKARVAIIDFDLHHGNGTQEIFYQDPNTLFVSSHRYPFYPGTGGMEEVGEGLAKGTTLNFPLGEEYGHEFFVQLYAELILPAVTSFNPEMIFVSAGFDGHEADPMRGLNMKTETFGFLAEVLIRAAEDSRGKILFVLEGGYNPSAVADSAMAVIEKMYSCPREVFRLNQTRVVGGHSALVQRFREVYAPYFPVIR